MFSGETDLKWLRILKPGFRHCFAAVEDGGRWIVYNPLCHQTEISILVGVGLPELMAWYAGAGHRVVPSTIDQAPHRAAPWGPYSCVEAVKRILGIQSRLVVTPWNLYNFLKNRNK